MTIFVTDIRDMGAVSKALAKALKGSVVTSTLVAVSALAVPGLWSRSKVDGRSIERVRDSGLEPWA